MAENKKKIIVYTDWLDMFEAMTDDEAGRLIKHFFRYVNDKDPIAPDRVTELVFEPIKAVLKRNLKHWENRVEQNRNNGTKGGRPKTENNPNKPNGFLDNRKKPDNDKDNDNDNVNDKDNDILNTSLSTNVSKEVEQQAAKSQKSSRFIKPTIDEIRMLNAIANLNIDPEQFFDFYESKDWMVGKNKMKDWKAAARNWARRNSTALQQTPSNNLKTQKQNENQHHNAHALKHLRSLEREGGFSPRTIEIARNYCLNEATTVDVYQLIPKLRELEGRVQDADTRHSGNTLWIGS